MAAMQQALFDITGVASNVYATWNPADKNSGVTLSNGNLTATSSVTGGLVRSTISKSSGKWYWEETVVSTLTHEPVVGVANSTANLTLYLGGDINGWGYYGDNGNKYNNNSGVAYGATFVAGDVIGMALDMNAGTLTFYKNGVSQGTAFTGLSGSIFAADGNTNESSVTTANFGATAFAFTVPSGFNPGLYN